ncbi:restriction endonuclease subunit S [Acinetobacter johnsonii]|uniref:restriction endonuclease subunit S n=1 Tax=Acinetobacter johnsonii TaxID=40214 RepID=UPI003AF5607A
MSFTSRIKIEDLINNGSILVHKDGNHGAKYPRAEEFGELGVPFLTAKLLDNSGNIDLLKAPRLAKEKAQKFTFGFVQPEDVLLSHNATVGRVAVMPQVDEPILIGTSLTHFRLDKSKILPTYLAAYFSGKDFQNQLAAVMSQTTRDQVPITSQRKLYIELPSIEIQAEIVKYLDSIDNKIRLNNKINHTLESIAQAMFKSWFIDFDPVRAKITAKQQGKDSELAAMCAISSKSEAELKQMSEEDFAELQATAALFPAELMESELGKVPNGWLPVNIEYFIELIYGKALKKTERIHGVYPVYGSGGLTGWHNKALVKGPGVIIGRKGTIGSIFLENKDFYPIDTTYYVKTKNNCSLLFAYYLLQTLGLEKMNTDAAVPGLNRQNFYHLEVPFYSSDLIEKYTKTIENIISKNLSIKKENEYLIGMRDSLLPKLLSGEVALGDVIDG